MCAKNIHFHRTFCFLSFKYFPLSGLETIPIFRADNKGFIFFIFSGSKPVKDFIFIHCKGTFEKYLKIFDTPEHFQNPE